MDKNAPNKDWKNININFTEELQKDGKLREEHKEYQYGDEQELRKEFQKYSKDNKVDKQTISKEENINKLREDCEVELLVEEEEIKAINAQEWLDKNYPKNGVCSLNSDKENYGKRRINIKTLSISGQKLEACLDLRDFVNLKILVDCSADSLSNKITKLKVSNCKKLQ
ncbi:3121_t:CDS:2, partial [Funneliformis geosporum]